MVFITLDLDRSGIQRGYLQVPYSYNLGGWANLMIPIIVVKNSEGPTALVLAGNHGDEYQGQIAIMKLARELRPTMVSGRIIMIPSMNLPSAKTGTRLSPLDGKNLNRSFPGNPEGTVTEMIADYLTRVLFPISDIVIDIHSGGRSMIMLPSSHMHLVSDTEQRRKMLAGMLAWLTDFSFIYMDIAGTGLLPVEAESQGKIVVTTEMGGSEAVSAEVHRITQNGLRNVLVHFGLLEGKEQTRESLSKLPTVLLQALKREQYLMAPESGVFEAMADLGAWIDSGQAIGQIHFLERPERPPETVTAPSDGYLVALRAPCLTQQGDCVALIAERVDPGSLA